MINDRNYYLIWSYEHERWWKAHKRGYTRDWLEAGLYTKDEAARICGEANRDSAQLEERMVRLDEVESYAFDLDLYRLMVRAERAGKGWHEVTAHLRSARAYVRQMMHPDDRKNSEG